MARPVYSRQFVTVTLTAGGSGATILPDTSTYVIRDITWTVSAGTSGGQLAVLIEGVHLVLEGYPAGVQAGFTREMRWVAPGPSTITYAWNGPTGAVDLTISGYELTP